MPDDDFNDLPRVASYEAVCQQLVECLKSYEGWLLYFRDGEQGDKRDLRYNEDIAKTRTFRKYIEGFAPMSRPQPKRRTHGFEVYEGDNGETKKVVV